MLSYFCFSLSLKKPTFFLALVFLSAWDVSSFPTFSFVFFPPDEDPAEEGAGLEAFPALFGPEATLFFDLTGGVGIFGEVIWETSSAIAAAAPFRVFLESPSEGFDVLSVTEVELELVSGPWSRGCLILDRADTRVGVW